MMERRDGGRRFPKTVPDLPASSADCIQSRWGDHRARPCGLPLSQCGPRMPEHGKIMDGRGSELNEAALSEGVGAEPRIGDVIEIALTARDAGLPLRVRAVVRDRTNDGFGAEFLAGTPGEERELSVS